MTVASVLGMNAAEVSVVKDAELLRIIQKEFAGEDVDFYLLNGTDSDEWTVFVDAEPMKGWWHDCYLLHVPKTADGLKAVSVKSILKRR